MEAPRKMNKGCRLFLERQAWINEYNSSSLNPSSHVAQDVSPQFSNMFVGEFRESLRKFNDPELNAVLDDRIAKTQCNYQTIPTFIKGILIENNKHQETLFILEHFFGSNRRINIGNDTSNNFKRTIKFQLLSSMIQKELHVSIKIPKRHHSSGAICEKSTEVNELTLLQGMCIAEKLINMTSPEGNWGSDTIHSDNQMYNWDEINIKDFLPQVI